MAQNEVIQQLLLEQQNFTKELLQQQNEWMQRILRAQAGGIIGGSSQAAVPPFHSFSKERQSWESYLEQLQQHFSAYAVASDEKQKSFFLAWVGTENFELLKNLCGSAQLQEYTHKQLTEKLTEHFQSKRHIVAARYEFFKCEMQPNQSYREYVAVLRGLARDCKFVCPSENCSRNFVDDMIRDQIITHTPHDAVCSASLQKLQATLADVMLIAESFETTTKAVAAIKERVPEREVPVNSIRENNYCKTKSNSSKSEPRFKSCSGCGTAHTRQNCKFKNEICNKCGKRGHISYVCLAKRNKQHSAYKDNKTKESRRVNNIVTVNNITGVVKRENDNKTYINLQIFDKIIKFQMDSGSSVSIISANTYKVLNCKKLRKTTKILYGFGNKQIPVLGEISAEVKCGEKIKQVEIVVADVECGENIFGFDLFTQFGFEIKQVSNVSVKTIKQIDALCKKYSEVFEPALGSIKDFKASIYLKNDAIPKFFKSRQIAFSQMPSFKREAERLTAAGIWKPIKFSQWASPIVLAPKSDGSLRICGDFKQAVNSQIDIERYPLPTRESLFHAIRCGQHFSKIDLKDAYLQMELDDKAKSIMVVNTPLGLFQYQRLAYGIASAPAIFQKYLEQLLQGIESCGNYLDDIIITAPTFDEHMQRLEKVLSILQDNGIKCKKQKCFFLQSKIEYLGRQISADGILPDESGLKAVRDLQAPKDLKQVEAFMGKVNYYHSFIPNYSQISAPINMLRRKNVRFSWGPSQQRAFNTLKQHILNATQLAHYDERLPLVLATDASSYGIGAVLSHIYPDGKERPIAFASKTLDKHQFRYSQIEKEGLSIIFGVKRFHQYLYGRLFTLITDHKPLVSIFNPSSKLPSMTSHRLQRWAITLMAYQYNVKYRKTSEHGNADALSRLPLGTDAEFDQQEACYNINELKTPINSKIIASYADKDSTLQRVRGFVEKGWPDKLVSQDLDLQPFFNRKNACTIIDNLLCLQTEFTRVIIPTALKSQILELLHEGHWGISRMKQLARQHVWWVNIDQDIAKLADNCDICKAVNAAPARQYERWPEPSKPWERVHIDFAGPFNNSMWLICVDAFSQFPFITQLSTTTTANTISALSAIFAIEGIPNTLVSDNGPQLTSDDFKCFCTKLGIKHVTSAPFHPASNGLAERFVRTFKAAVKKNIEDGLQLNAAVTKFLSTYRSMPNAKGKSPAELLHGRKIRTLLSQVFEPQTEKSQKSACKPKFYVKQSVFARNYARGEKWLKAEIVRQLGKMVYVVKTSCGYLKRHANQLKSRKNSELETTPIKPDVTTWSLASQQSSSSHNEQQENSSSSSQNEQPAQASSEDLITPSTSASRSLTSNNRSAQEEIRPVRQSSRI